MEVLAVRLGADVEGWFTGRDRARADPPVGLAGNLSHRRPHLPGALARDRVAACSRMGLEPGRLHLMRQAHGAAVAEVRADTPVGAELRGVDALVTAEPDRPLVVQVADCVPVLVGAEGAIAAIHAGRRGVVAGVVEATLTALSRHASLARGRAMIGPAIGACCYEVDAELRDEVGAAHPEAVGLTTWGTPALDLPAVVERQLRASGIPDVERVGTCTRCDPDRRWFSHRADPSTGRQLGVVVRRAGAGKAAA